MRFVARIAAAGAVALLACKAKSASPPLPEGAVSLFDVHFSAPDDKPGAPVKVYAEGAAQTFPSSIPSQVFMGKPTVVEQLCGLDEQPLRLQSASGAMGHEGIEFLLSQRYARYHVELDLCVAQLGPPPRPASEPQLALFLDFPQADGIGFWVDGNIGIVDPEQALAGNTTVQPIGRWQVNKPLRLALDADVPKQSWTISIDGAKAYEGKVNAYLPRAVRVMVRGNDLNQAAIDNFRVWAEDELVKASDPQPLAPRTGNE